MIFVVKKRKKIYIYMIGWIDKNSLLERVKQKTCLEFCFCLNYVFQLTQYYKYINNFYINTSLKLKLYLF